jgi:hypothetical protein
MDSGIEAALISVSVSLAVSFISPWWTHKLWKRQKLKEQQLAVAERFAAVLAGFPEDRPDEPLQLSWHFTSLMVLIGTLFKNRELREVAVGLVRTEPPLTCRLHAREFGRLQALLFEEALEIKRNQGEPP